VVFRKKFHRPLRGRVSFRKHCHKEVFYISRPYIDEVSLLIERVCPWPCNKPLILGLLPSCVTHLHYKETWSSVFIFIVSKCTLNNCQMMQVHSDDLLFSKFIFLRDLRSSRLKALTFSPYGLLLLLAISQLAYSVGSVDVWGWTQKGCVWKGCNPPWVWWSHYGWKAARMGRSRVNHLLTVPCNLSHNGRKSRKTVRASEPTRKMGYRCEVRREGHDRAG
jgi:hypothetical protein